ncbi:hypothetical protein DYQ94_06495 [Xanthomonas sp. LMG 8993]|nr:hypothetical protein [Xanthomonas sp. LMG 8993]
MLFKYAPVVLSLGLTAGCTQSTPQVVPKGLLVTADKGQIIVVGDGFSCAGVTKAHPGEDGLKDAVTGWVECKPDASTRAPVGPSEGA